MATTPTPITINNNEYTRVVNNSTSYLVQNTSANLVLIAGSDADLGAATATDLGGYKVESLKSITNTQLQDYAYVYAKSTAAVGEVRV